MSRFEDAMRQVREDLREGLRDPGAVYDRAMEAKAARRDVVRAWLEVFEAILDVAAFSSMDDDVRIPVWPTLDEATRAEFESWPQLTVGMVRELEPILRELAR